MFLIFVSGKKAGCHSIDISPFKYRHISEYRFFFPVQPFPPYRKCCSFLNICVLCQYLPLSCVLHYIACIISEIQMNYHISIYTNSVLFIPWILNNLQLVSVPINHTGLLLCISLLIICYMFRLKCLIVELTPVY